MREQPRSPALAEILDRLAQAAWAGCSVDQLVQATGKCDATIRATLGKLQKRGLATWREEDNEGTRLRYRWWLPKYAPKTAVLDAESLARIALPRTGTLADPWGVKNAPAVIDGRECSAWALAVTRA
jgi:DNA-binding IclR family transcriptional regulator